MDFFEQTFAIKCYDLAILKISDQPFLMSTVRCRMHKFLYVIGVVSVLDMFEQKLLV